MQEWFENGGCDGFVLAATHLPGAFEEFVRMVVPILQERGLFRRDYSGPTLRDHLGIEPRETTPTPEGEGFVAREQETDHNHPPEGY
jgi:hypothetical protein